MEIDKAAERTQLVMHLGRLMAGLHTLANQPVPPTQTEYRIAAAQYKSDVATWVGSIYPFAKFGEIRFDYEIDEIVRDPQNMTRTLFGLAQESHDPSSKQQYLREQIRICEERALKGIHLIPIEWVPRLLDERTPFSACMSIRDAMLTAQRRVHYFDRYVKEDFFPLYLRSLQKSLEIRIATTRGRSDYGVQNILPLARLAAAEFSDFQLIECDQADMHDRNLRVDDQVFFLGPSIDAAGKAPTNFSPGDSSASAHSIFDAVIARGRRAV